MSLVALHRPLARSTCGWQGVGGTLRDTLRCTPLRRRLPSPDVRTGDEARRTAGAHGGGGVLHAGRRPAALDHRTAPVRQSQLHARRPGARRPRAQRHRAEGRTRARRHAPVVLVQQRPHPGHGRCAPRTRPGAPAAGGGSRPAAALDRRHGSGRGHLLRHHREPAGPLSTAVRTAAPAGIGRRLRHRPVRQHAGARRRHAADRHRCTGRCAVPRARAAPHRQCHLPARAGGPGPGAGAAPRRARQRRTGPLRHRPVRLQRDGQRRIQAAGRDRGDPAQGGG